MKKTIILFAFGILAYLPFPAIGLDENIASIGAVAVTDSRASVQTSYGITMSLASNNTLGANDTIAVLIGEKDGDPALSEFDFTDTVFGPAIGISGTGEPMALGDSNNAYLITLDSAPTSINASFGLEDVLNGPDGCYILMLSTSAVINESADFTYSDFFEIGNGLCFDEQAELIAYDVAAFGTNIGLSWEAQDDGNSGYYYKYTTIESDLSVDGPPPDTLIGTFTNNTSAVIQGLEENTTYYGNVSSVDEDNLPISGSETFTVTTGTEIAEQVFNKPKIKDKKKRTYNVNWKTWKDSLADNELDYVENLILQIKNKNKTKVIKKFKELSAANNSKKIAKKYTQQNKIYWVRIKAKYITDETTKYSKWVKVEL